MKGKLKIIGILTLAFVVFVVAKLLFDIAGKKEGRLHVTSTPPAAVFIDNVMKGKTPYEDAIKQGTYTLKIIPEQVATQAASWQKTISIYTDTLTYVDTKLESSDIASSAEVYWLTQKTGWGIQNPGLMVESEPSGALVSLDTDEKGITPLTIDNVPEGTHELSVFMPGFSRRTKKINIVKGFTLHAYIKMPVDPSQAPKYQIDTPQIATAAANLTQPKNTVQILDTPTGWLRVRDEPTLAGSESARVNPGQVFEYLDEQDGWYKIKVDSKTDGWISSEYAKKQ